MKVVNDAEIIKNRKLVKMTKIMGAKAAKVDKDLDSPGE